MIGAGLAPGFLAIADYWAVRRFRWNNRHPNLFLRIKKLARQYHQKAGQGLIRKENPVMKLKQGLTLRN